MMQYKGCNFYMGYEANDKLRLSLDALAKQVFGGLSFERWYQSGHWSSGTIPYSLFDQGRCVASLFINPFTLNFGGQHISAAQIGTVMTAPEHQGQGMSRFLIELALSDWKSKVDAMYLYANDSVTRFYPLFGFREWTESDFLMTLPKGEGLMEKLDIDRDREWILGKIAQGNPYAEVTVENRTDIMMFFLGGWYRECLYRLPEQDALLIVLNEDGKTTVADVFTDGKLPLDALLSRALAKPQTAKLGFQPHKEISCKARPSQEQNNHCFVLGDPDGLFAREPLHLPLLCRA